MKVTCNQCRHRFELDLKPYKQKIQGYDLTLANFRCPVCGRLYKTLLYSAKLKEKIDERKDLLIAARETSDPDQRVDMIERTKEMAEEIKQERRELVERLNLNTV